MTKPESSGRKLQDSSLPPCTFGMPIADYFNRVDVRNALHIPTTVQAWELCTDEIEYNVGSTGSQWIYEQLAATGKYRMLHYSGDVDGAVPTLGTYNWIQSLGWDVTTEWYAYSVQDQVAGYIESYNNDLLTFATVHGAGHMAPQYKREQTYYLIFEWLKGNKP